MAEIPGQTKQWSQLNKGDLLGTLFSTRNIDLDTQGILKLAQRTRYVGQTTSGNLTDILAIVYGNFKSTSTDFHYWIISTGGLYTLSFDLATFAADALANTPTTHAGSDGCTWNGDLYVTKTSRVSKLSGGTWTASWSSADFTNTASGFPHPIEVNVTNTDVLIGDGNLLKRCISDGTIDTALTLPSNYKIIWIRRGANVNYIGLDSNAGGLGAVAVWDGLTTTLEANPLVNIKARTPLSGVVDDEGQLHIIQSDGRLMRYNGSGFAYEAELPPYRNYLARRDWGGFVTVAGRVFQRGMAIIRGRIHITLDASLNNTPSLIPNFLSGVWVYDPDNQAFYHKYAPSYSNTVKDFGQAQGTAFVSALFPFVEGRNTDPTASVGGVLLTGGRLSDDSGSTVRNVVSVTTGENRGQFSTVRIESQGITDDVLSIWCMYEGINNSTDKIIFKYRTSYREAFKLSSGIPTWTSTTTFTTTDTNAANVDVGDELLILAGNGAGGTTHVSSVSESSGTYTITVDEAITGIAADDVGAILVDNWKKLPTTITNADTLGYKRIPLPIKNVPWFQIKGELRGEGGIVGIQKLKIYNKNNIPIG